MPDPTQTSKPPEAPQYPQSTGKSSRRRPTKKQVEDVVARLRGRGTVNAMMSDPAKAFEAANPDLVTVWAHSPPGADQFDVTSKKSLGYTEVYSDEIPADVETPHTMEQGPVRVGDAILMCIPREIHEAIDAENARIATEEANLPVEEYNRRQRELSIQGHRGRPFGGIKQTSEYIHVDLSKLNQKTEEEGR